MAKRLTITGMTNDLRRRLTALATSKGQSVNTLVLRFLEEAVGLDARRQHLNRYMTLSLDSHLVARHAVT